MDAARKFFAEHYPLVATLVDELLQDFASRGVTTRRNWWVPLAGGAGGRTMSVSGREFPVLEVAQLRQGVPITANAIRRKPGEPDPPGFLPGRWAPKTKRKSRRLKRERGKNSR
jgi:hypothetical protein